MKIILKCESCGSDFETDYKFRNKKYCNRECYINHGIKGKSKQIDLYEKRVCIQCSNVFEIRKKQPNKLCSDECRKIWNLKNTKIRTEKSRNAIIKKYGGDFFKSKEFQKYKGSNSEGLKKYYQSNKHKDKTFKSQFNSAKIRVEKQGFEFINFTGKSVEMKCIKCGFIFSHSQHFREYKFICRKCEPLPTNNNLNVFIENILNEHNIHYEKNNRNILEGKEIDYLIGNVGLEINGNYYHSEIHGGKDKKYHINKTNKANDKNIKLIHIFEDEIINKPKIVESRILNLLNKNKNKIYARKCSVREIDYNTSKEFLNINHIQGNSVDKIRLGLFYENEMVSVMTFGKKRKCTGNNDALDEYELLRFCNKLQTIVVGGFSKLFNFFIKNFKPKNILTYADIRWSGTVPETTVYNKLEFKYIRISPPNYWYVKVGEFNKRIHRFSFRKDTLIKEGYNPKNTEWEIMQIKNYDRIWDCGNLVFEWNLL